MAGSSGRFARGSSHQKWTAYAHRAPAAFLVCSIIALISGVSGFAGGCGVAGCCARAEKANARSKTNVNRVIVIAVLPEKSLETYDSSPITVRRKPDTTWALYWRARLV